MNKSVRERSEEGPPREIDEMGRDRRQFLVLSAAAGACAMQVPTASAEEATAIAPPGAPLPVAMRPVSQFFSRSTSRHKS